jgi:dTDP-4-dehydrorhamnose reductase
MKALVLGGAGMLGHKVVQRLSGGPVELWWTLRGSVDDVALAPVPFLRTSHALEHMDATRTDLFEGRVRDLRPDLVINCLGVIKQRSEADNERVCTHINAELPRRLAELLSSWGGRLIHISTDCVFDGARGRYTEQDTPNAGDVYGRSKAMGEVRAENVVVLRTSFIGRELRHHKSLLDWFLSQNGRKISGFRRAVWSGVTTAYLAEILETVVMPRPGLAGIYHVAAAPLSKYDLLVRLREAYDLDVDIVPDDSFVRDFSLDTRKLETETGFRAKPWSAQIDTLVADPTPYPAMSLSATGAATSAKR